MGWYEPLCSWDTLISDRIQRLKSIVELIHYAPDGLAASVIEETEGETRRTTVRVRKAMLDAVDEWAQPQNACDRLVGMVMLPEIQYQGQKGELMEKVRKAVVEHANVEYGTQKRVS